MKQKGVDILLAIITINLNNAEGLEKTIISILNQSFKDYELIIIDGKSTDNSVDIIKKYEKEISCWISEPDTGIYNAMNKGILKAKGKYCFFLNSGDCLYNNTTLQSIFQDNLNADIVFGNLKVINPDKSIETIYGKPNLTFMDLFLSNVVKHQSSFIRTQIFYKYGFYNENNKIVSDWEFFMKVLGFHNVSYRYVNTAVAYFDNNGISNHSNDLCVAEKVAILNKEIAPLILADYKKWSELKFLEFAKLYKWSWFLIRLVSKMAKTSQKLMKRK